MKKYFNGLLLMGLVLVCLLSLSGLAVSTAKAQSVMSYGELIELFISLGIIPPDKTAAARATVGKAETVPLYRFYNSVNGAYLYTTDTVERDAITNAISTTYLGWIPQGITGYLYPTQATGTTAVYRLYNSRVGDRFYTIDSNEKDIVSRNSGWSYEGVAGYINTTKVAQTVPVTRMFNAKTGIHHYTGNQAEINDKKQNGWITEGILGYIVPGKTAPLPPSAEDLYASCQKPGKEAKLVWSPTSNTNNYMVRASNKSDGKDWNGLCDGAQNTGDACETVTTPFLNFTSIANASYDWWVHACNKAGCSEQTNGPVFSCNQEPVSCNKGGWVGATSTLGLLSGTDREDNPDERFLCHTDKNFYRCTKDSDETASSTAYWNTFSFRINNGAPTPNYVCDTTKGKWVSTVVIPSGSLVVRGSPAGVRVFVDGQNMGLVASSTAGLVLPNIASSTYSILLTKTGYTSYSTTTTVRTGATTTINYTLTSTTAPDTIATSTITTNQIYCRKGSWLGKNSTTGLWDNITLVNNPDQRFLCHTDKVIYRCSKDSDEIVANTAYWNTFSTKINNGAPTPNYTCDTTVGKWIPR